MRTQQLGKLRIAHQLFFAVHDGVHQRLLLIAHGDDVVGEHFGVQLQRGLCVHAQRQVNQAQLRSGEALCHVPEQLVRNGNVVLAVLSVRG